MLLQSKLEYAPADERIDRSRTPTKRFDLVHAADRDIGELTVTVVHEVHMVRDRPGLQHSLLFERGAGR